MTKDYKIQIIINAKDEAGKVLSGVGKNLQTVGAVALGAAGIVTGALAGIGAGIAKLAIDAAPVAGVRAAFEGLAESAGASADDLLGALKKGSAGMVAQSDLMESFNKAAQLVGIDFAQTLPDAMGYLGKVAGATGQDLDYMLDSLVTGVGRLSPMILDNLGIQVNLTEANEAYAKSIGKTVGDLTKAEQQTALMAQVMEKLEVNTAAMPDVAGTAAAGIAGLQAGMQDFKDQIGVAVLPILQKFMGVLSNLFSEIGPKVIRWVEDAVEIFGFLWQYLAFTWEEGDYLNDWLAELPGPIKKIVKPIGEFIAILRDLIPYFTIVVGEGDYLNDFLTHLPKPVQGIVRTIGKLVVVIKDLVSYFTIVVGEGDYLNDFLTHLPEPIQGIVRAIGEFVAKVIEWVTENVELKDVLIAFGIAIASIVIPAIISIIAAIAPVIATIVAVIAAVTLLRMAWENNFLGIRTTLTQFWENTAKPALTQLWAWLQVNIPMAIETLKAAIETLKGFWDTVLVPAMERVGLAIGKLVAFWKNTLLPALQIIWSFIQENVVPLFAAWADLVTAVVVLAFTVLAELWENIFYPILERVWKFIQDKVIPIFTILAGAAKDELGPPLEFLAEKVLPALEKAFKAIVSIVQSAIEFVYGLVNAIKEIDLPHWLTPGSPTPFEYALVGIADAMQDVALSANVMGGALAMSMPAGGDGGSVDNRAYSDTYNTTINDTDTGALFMALVDERQRNRFNEYMGVN